MNTSEKMMKMAELGEVRLTSEVGRWFCGWTLNGVYYSGEAETPSAAVDDCIAKSHRSALFVKEEPKKK